MSEVPLYRERDESPEFLEGRDQTCESYMYHSTLGLRAITRRRRREVTQMPGCKMVAPAFSSGLCVGVWALRAPKEARL